MKYLMKVSFLMLAMELMLSGGIALAAASAADVNQALQALHLTSAEKIMAAFEIGFSQGRLQPEEALHLVKRLSAAEGSLSDKEAILLTIAHALEDDLPVSTLVNKVEEGLARSVPLLVILNGSGGQPLILGLVQRECLLGTVRDLLYSKRIFSAPEGTQAASTFLPLRRFDALVTNIADSLGEYLEGDGDPYDGFLLYQAMSTRLRNQSSAESIIPAEDVDLVLDRIKPGDLTPTVLKALNQP
jgi:hypothetical protein